MALTSVMVLSLSPNETVAINSELTESLMDPMVARLNMYTNKVRYLLTKKRIDDPVRLPFQNR